MGDEDAAVGVELLAQSMVGLPAGSITELTAAFTATWASGFGAVTVLIVSF